MTHIIPNPLQWVSKLAVMVSFFIVSQAQASTKEFIIQPGALVEAIYINASSQKKDISKTDLQALKSAIQNSGGQHLASFEVKKSETIDFSTSHVIMIQWADPAGRTALTQSRAYTNVEQVIVGHGFYGAQQETPVKLDTSKLYDFTAAWTVAKSPKQMEVVMHVVGVYFGKIGPVLQKYGISTKVMFSPHPAAPEVAKHYFPQIMGLFEWQKMSDVHKFENDPDFTEHVDIRNSIFKRKEDKILATLLNL